MCTQAPIICMKSSEARRIRINLISFQKHRNVDQEADSDNKDGWEKGEERRSGFPMDTTLGLSGTSTVIIRVLPSGAGSAVLGSKLAPHLDRRASSHPKMTVARLTERNKQICKCFPKLVQRNVCWEGGRFGWSSLPLSKWMICHNSKTNVSVREPLPRRINSSTCKHEGCQDRAK